MDRSSNNIRSLAQSIYAQALLSESTDVAQKAVGHTRNFLSNLINTRPDDLVAFRNGVEFVHQNMDVTNESFGDRANALRWTEDQRALVREMLEITRCEVIC